VVHSIGTQDRKVQVVLEQSSKTVFALKRSA
jgi:hypothetical protein